MSTHDGRSLLVVPWCGYGIMQYNKSHVWNDCNYCVVLFQFYVAVQKHGCLYVMFKIYYIWRFLHCYVESDRPVVFPGPEWKLQSRTKSASSPWKYGRQTCWASLSAVWQWALHESRWRWIHNGKWRLRHALSCIPSYSYGSTRRNCRLLISSQCHFWRKWTLLCTVQQQC